jgi:hypothetical protein
VEQAKDGDAPLRRSVGLRGDPQLVRLDAASIDAVAARVVGLMCREWECTTPLPGAGGLVTAAEVARRFALRREWVYENADRLGVVRLGEARGRGCGLIRGGWPPRSRRGPPAGSTGGRRHATRRTPRKVRVAGVLSDR